jgi:hypothetical protein
MSKQESPRILWVAMAAALCACTRLSAPPAAPAPGVPPVPLPPFSALAVPDASQVVDRLCAGPPFMSYGDGPMMANKPDRDPATGNILGAAYVTTFCKDEKLIYFGCADIEWDPTGTTVVKYTARWRVKEPFTVRDTGGDWYRNVGTSCFNMKSGGNG